MVWIALAIAVSLAAGVRAERQLGAPAGDIARRLLKFLLYVVTPVVVFFNLARLEVTADIGAGILFGWTALALTAGIAWLIGRRVLHLEAPSAGVLAIVALQANTGMLGLPVVAVVLGFDHLSEAVAYDALVQQPVFLFGSFAIAAATGTRAGETGRERLRAFFVRNPPLFAVLAALLAPDALAPDVLVDASRILVLSVPALGFFAIGVTLAAEAEDGALRFPPPLTPAIGAAIGVRLVLAPLLLVALSVAFIDLPASFIILAAMPAGLYIVSLAHVYGLDVSYAASSIVWTTMVAVPVLLVGAILF